MLFFLEGRVRTRRFRLVKLELIEIRIIESTASRSSTLAANTRRASRRRCSFGFRDRLQPARLESREMLDGKLGARSVAFAVTVGTELANQQINDLFPPSFVLS